MRRVGPRMSVANGVPRSKVFALTRRKGGSRREQCRKRSTNKDSQSKILDTTPRCQCHNVLCITDVLEVYRPTQDIWMQFITARCRERLLVKLCVQHSLARFTVTLNANRTVSCACKRCNLVPQSANNKLQWPSVNYRYFEWPWVTLSVCSRSLMVKWNITNHAKLQV